MKNLFLFIILMFSLTTFGGNSDKDKKQNKTITGQVTDANGELIAGARLVVAETGEEFFADFEGRFQITIEKGESQTLKIESAGFLPLQVKTNAIASFADFSLKAL